MARTIVTWIADNNIVFWVHERSRVDVGIPDNIARTTWRCLRVMQE